LRPPLTVATYNIHSCVGSDNVYSVERIGNVIKEFGDADVVALQEVEVNLTSQKTRLWSTIHNDDQAAMLSDLTDMKYHSFAKSISCISDTKFKEEHDTRCSKDGHFGIAILSKHPILEERVLMYKRYKLKSLRNALAVKIVVNNTPIWFICTHLGCHIGPEQQQQAKELSEWMNSSQFTDGGVKTIICMGDYNSPPWFEAAKTIKQNGFRDCRGRNTFPALGWPCCFWMTCCPPIFKLDYCVYKSEEYYCNEDGADVLADKSLLVASDHRPLKVIFYSTEKVADVVLERDNVSHYKQT